VGTFWQWVHKNNFFPTLISLPSHPTLQKEEREARDAEQLEKAKKLTPVQAFTGGATGLAIAFVLYGFTQTIVGTMDGKAVPENYQARQITITVRTIVSGLAYLATFVYAANGTGLIALAAQKWLDKLTGVDLIDEQTAAWEEEKKEREEQGISTEEKE
tara:strand:- start:7691 stop:8167 length:477 start_codon:yes stop_codon:yes gene_type:complete